MKVGRAFIALGGSLLAFIAIALTIQVLRPDYAGVRAGRADAGYLESGDCRKCHEWNYATWHATFHRTMTREADEEALASIRRCAILALAVPAMSREQAERWATRGAADRVARAMREHDVWVAVEGAAIGWVEVDRDRVAALYVSPSCSRRGVGSVLLTFAETSIRSSGYTTARLESSQNALDYYLRRGYLRCGPADSDGAWPLRKDLAAVTPNQGMDTTR